MTTTAAPATPVRSGWSWPGVPPHAIGVHGLVLLAVAHAGAGACSVAAFLRRPER